MKRFFSIRRFRTSLIGMMCLFLLFVGLFADSGFLIGTAQAQGVGVGGSSPLGPADTAKPADSATPQLVPCGAWPFPVQCTDLGVAEATINRIKKSIDFQLTYAAYLGVLNATTYVAQTVAYDAAEWFASGFKGNGPLYEVLTFGDYNKRLLAESVGEFIGTFSDAYTEGVIGVDLCRPPRFEGIALEFALNIPEVGITGLQRPRPKCSWSDIVDNWDATASSLDNVASLRNIRASFSSGGNDLAFGIGLNTAFFDAIAEKREAGILDRLENKGLKPVSDIITGNIKTPAEVVNESIKEQLLRQPNASQNLTTGALLNNAFTLGWQQIGTVTLSTFTNVLITRLLGKITKGLFNPSSGQANLADLLTNPYAAPGGSGDSREIIATQYEDILTPNITSAEQRDLLAELVGCPAEGRTVWNCTINALLETALRQGGGLTVRQAIDQGFLNADYQLIPSTQLKDNVDPLCAQRAFCVANLRKMRLARIVPVGWEMAADSPENQARCTSGRGCVTLGEVIQNYDSCNANGEPDSDNPWCHLIDPNWVLTTFPAQCLTNGYGNSFLSGTNERAKECQDTVTCLERDVNGKCKTGYGYCLAEQTFWQFDALTCNEQNVSCRTFKPRGNNAQSVGYLRSTLDYGSCNESNVGCMWYATVRDASRRDQTNAWTATFSAPQNKVYFDKTIARCESSYDGCSDLRVTKSGSTALNLLRNSSFEEVDPVSNALKGWVRERGSYLEDESPTVYVRPEPASGSPAVDGSQSYLSLAPPSMYQLIRLQSGRQYTFSFYARQFTGGPRRGGATIAFYRSDDSNPNMPPAEGSSFVINDTSFFRSSDCASASNQPSGGSASRASILLPSSLGNDWRRFECSFSAPEGTGWARVYLVRGSGDPWLADAVQIEESEVALAYHEGLDPLLESIAMKIPPTELGCTGDEETDHPLCANYARVCRSSEAGCQGYTSVNQPSSPEIPAVLTSADTCPSECVGYSEFRKQASTFDLVRNPSNTLIDDPDDDTSVAFIPKTALSCSAQDVGCEAFTNLDVATQGGEQSAAFSYLRSCQKPDNDTQTYYTWEGSEASGYQLVTWSLQRDTTAPLPQPPRIIAKAGPDGFLKDPQTCNALSYVTGIDPDCRQFYDPEGNASYRFESQTVIADVACTQYRKDGSTRADCEKTGGTYSAATNQCLYMALPKESRTCGLAVSGCRAYIGTQGNAQAAVFDERFAADEYAVEPGANISALSRSEESVLVGDTSLRIAPNAGRSGDVFFDVPTEPGVLYELTFWGKAVSAQPVQISVSVPLTLDANATRVGVGTAMLRNQWNVFRVGPFSGSSSGSVTRVILSGFSSQVHFIDTIQVVQVTDVAYVVKDSWNTPAVCDRTSEGIPQPRAMLGCRDYTDRNLQTVHARQFTNLCRETAIGCTKYVNTRNSEDPYEQRWEREDASRTELTSRLADSYEYYIADQAKMCPASQIGCRAFGLPKFNQTRTDLDAPSPFETVYLKDDVTQYDEGICSETELFCEAFTYSAGGTAGTEYFRSPSDHACEYREGAVVAYRDPSGNAVPNSPGCALENPEQYVGATYNGWFRVGTECPCYPELLRQGSAFGIRYTGDAGFNAWEGSDPALYAPGSYQSWAGICPQAQAECTELRDPNDKSDPLHPMGRAYFVINDERLDKESCAGNVDPGRGCVLFRDMSNPAVSYSTLATFDDYKNRGYVSVAPIDCESNSEHPSCVATRSPDGVAYNDSNLVLKVNPDRACSQWLSCETSETVYDSQNGRYKSICSDLALCNRAGVNEGEGVPFCENYVDRSSGSSETILKKYHVLNAKAYATRPVGFGSVDYSGFSMPDRFQIMDTSLKPIGADLIPDKSVAGKFKKDYRLAVGIPMMTENGSLVRGTTSRELEALAGEPELQPFSCFFRPTGSYGLLTDRSGILDPNRNGVLDPFEGMLCWLSLDQGQPANLGISGAALVSDNLNAIKLIDRFAQNRDPKLDQVLSSSFPNTQCKAAPQADAPFGNEFVTEWDDSVNPPEPSRVIPGYGNANFCEYGEACSCVYKRVQYGGMSKFYEPLSTDVINAICIGGNRDGLPCIADSSIAGSQEVNVTVNVAASGDENNPQSTNISVGSGAEQGLDLRCGSGVCTPISAVQLVRGVTGQCLQYDISRPIAGDQSNHECLVWNPNPVLTGPGDQYHWSPTAGYQPPQSSGRYYCTAPIRPPRQQQFSPQAVWPEDIPEEGLSWSGAITSIASMPIAPLGIAAYSAADAALGGPDMTSSCGEDDEFVCKKTLGPWPNSEGTYAGRIKNLFYADWFTSDGSCSNFWAFDGCTGNEGGASIDGHKAGGTIAGDRCEQIDDEDGQAFVKDENLMRLVMTGQGVNRSYAEYAILFNPAHTAFAALGFPPTDWDTVFNYSLEDTIANFEFSVPKKKIGCAYTQRWGDVTVDDYNADSDDGWGNKDKEWHANFTRYLQGGGGTLNRSTARILTEDGSPGGVPVKMRCAIQGSADGSDENLPPDNRGGEDGLCFVKTWELDYQANGQQKFQAFTPDIGRNSLDHLSRRPVFGKCDSAKNWFSIRAVFEDTNPSENTREAVEVKPDELVGPFQFVGLWVTTCAPGEQTEYIYMDMKMNSADVCRELAETISKDSHESAAFTDRNSSVSGYSMKNGFSWNTTNIPFGASLATGDAGEQPLFMTGVKQAEVNPLNPPTFTYPGQTYFSSTKYPTSNWGMLSNVFAKIYRILGYYPRPVTRDDFACTDPRSPQFGQWCPPVDRLRSKSELANRLDKDVEELTSQEVATTVEGASAKYCGFQGTCLKGGVDATQLFSQKVCNVFSGVNRGLDCSSDPDICHVAPIREDSQGNLVPEYGSCELFTGYVDTDTTPPSKTVNQRWERLGNGNYRCYGILLDTGILSDCPDNEETGCSDVIGCSRATAIKAGAFRCSNDSVRGPSKVKERVSGHLTYASYCTRESEESTECPKEIEYGSCIKIQNGVGTCEGRPWAQCRAVAVPPDGDQTMNTDCHFSARNFWPSGAVNDVFYWTRTIDEAVGLGQHLDRLNQNVDSGQDNYLGPGGGARFIYAIDRGGSMGDDPTWFTAWVNEDGEYTTSNGNKVRQLNAETYREAFWPAIPGGLDIGSGWSNRVAAGQFDDNTSCSEEGSCFFATRINTANEHFWPGSGNIVTNDRIVTYTAWNDAPLLSLYPGFNPHIWWDDTNDGGDYGWASANINTSVDDYNNDDQALSYRRVIDEDNPAVDEDNPLMDLPPYVRIIKTSQYDETEWNAGQGELWAHYGACESLPLMFRDLPANESNRTILGVCRGGNVDGRSCSDDTDCRPSKAPNGFSTIAEAQAESETWCNPVTTGSGEEYRQSPGSEACWVNGDDTSDPRHPSREGDPARDNNICTHPAGYWPRPEYCNDPDDEYCGLFGYSLTEKLQSVNDRAPLPTDVSPGLYTPLYLYPEGADTQPPTISGNSNDYSYVSYYNPIPPHTAAPDMRTCQGSQCRVTALDTFSVNGLAEGVINGGTGSHKATVRFYAWASHEQMPLRRVLIDWGDGKLSELPDAYLENRKPYCGVQTECSETPGLTCHTDADCPIGGGQCVPTGNCSTDPSKRCSRDAQCESGGEPGFCDIRTYFGNADGSCEEQYFEFSHAYSCDISAEESLPVCGNGRHCSRDPKRSCSSNANCAPGDSCLANLSSSLTGCFDEESRACLFTPRLMLIDNWGWCTGECRVRLLPNGQLDDGTMGQGVKHPNGGCYDGSDRRTNVNFTKPDLWRNSCALNYPSENVTTDRPWIVFPGSIQLLPGEDL